jgi:putative tryptophan/tyrosine transport system substrate-binding protein
MKRREFITLVGGCAIAWPLSVRAQQTTVPVVGFLHGAALADGFAKAEAAGFRSGLAETGYIEGRNVVIEYRWAESHYDRLPDLATDLIRRNVAVIAAGTTPAALAAKAATATIPIVFQFGVDPVKAGVVSSLNHPGGNVTGIVNLSPGLMAKRIELIHQVVPDAKIIAALLNPAVPAFSDQEVADAQAAHTALGIQVELLAASTPAAVDAAFSKAVELHAVALVVGSDILFIVRPIEMAALAMRFGIPSIHPVRGFVAAGGLMSYGSDFVDAYRLMGIYTGRVLKGEKPANLPVQQATKFEMVINLKAAKALDLTLPIALLGRADEVIE